MSTTANRNKKSSTIGILVNQFWKRPGQHGLEIGTTGTGKTQGLVYLLDGLVKWSPKSCLVWVDTGKTSEMLLLSKFRPLNLLIPEGCDIIVKPAEGADIDIKKTYITSYADVWHHLDPDRINVISFYRFVRDHSVNAKVVSKIFRELINMAYDYHLPTPLDIFIDEFQFIAPAKHIAQSYDHYLAGMDVVSSLYTMRSLKVRFVAATQSLKVINPAARDSFPWYFIRRGSIFMEGKLARFNELWAQIPTNKAFIGLPSRDFGDDRIAMPFYGDGEELGYVYYKGILKIKKEKPETTETEEEESEEKTVKFKKKSGKRKESQEIEFIIQGENYA
ncbi:hypothetical protein F1737_09055 [Methanoplanus sp. FWC-SCC4]|uniref:Uncharacterized protein n=1 Tax=Methanochimaera problematica TaxID=2609417 RepID=A0AA97FDE8_9EURY|nr:hypothetical protein [Methanoplanus sp. FWC-SCC4]WOF16827.1 hypothetical protein F1737_09055 [Methanoplanus sp. FWC-SCC4]